MSLHAKIKGTNFIAPAFYILLSLFFTAQLAIITALGTTFTGTMYSQNSPPESTAEAETSKVINTAPLHLDHKTARNQTATRASNAATKLTLSSKFQRKFPLLDNPTSWPPVENKPYPDMELYNQDGVLTRLSDLAGNVIIVQPVAMGCPMSQAYSGANRHDKKAFGLCFPTLGVQSFRKQMLESTGISMGRCGLVHVQILLFNMHNKPVTIEDARRWAKHFDLKTSNNQYVLVATPEMSEKSKTLIPGFHLIDRSFQLRSDSAGLLPKRSLCGHFFPTLQTLFPQALTYQSETAN